MPVAPWLGLYLAPWCGHGGLFGLSGDEANCHSAETWATGHSLLKMLRWCGYFGLIGLFEFPCGDGSKPWYLVNPKIAGKWMFIPLKCIYRYWPIPMSFRWCVEFQDDDAPAAPNFELLTAEWEEPWMLHMSWWSWQVMHAKSKPFFWEPSWWHLQLLYLPHLVPWIAGEELHEVGCWLLVSISCSGTSNRSGPWLPR